MWSEIEEFHQRQTRGEPLLAPVVTWDCPPVEYWSVSAAKQIAMSPPVSIATRSPTKPPAAPTLAAAKPLAATTNFTTTNGGVPGALSALPTSLPLPTAHSAAEPTSADWDDQGDAWHSRHVRTVHGSRARLQWHPHCVLLECVGQANRCLVPRTVQLIPRCGTQELSNVAHGVAKSQRSIPAQGSLVQATDGRQRRWQPHMTLLRDNLANTELLQRMEDRGLQPNVISYVLLPFT